jgi:hypothetical protein
LDQLAFQFSAILPLRLQIALRPHVLELVAVREDATALHRDARADSTNACLVLMLAALLVSVVRQSQTLSEKEKKCQCSRSGCLATTNQEIL